jgi:acyl carrier protein
MSNEQLTSLVRAILHTIVPEADLDHLDPHVSYRDQFAFDSVDYVQFVLALEQALHLTITEADYPQLSTLHGCVTYLTTRLTP